MNFLKRAVLYLVRKKGRITILIILLFLMSCCIQTGISFKMSAEKEAENLRKSLATGFILEVDMKNEEYLEEWSESGNNGQVYAGPKMTDVIIQKILSIDGVNDCILDLSMYVWTDLNLKSGMWALAEAEDDPNAQGFTMTKEDLMVRRNQTQVWSCRNGEKHKNFRTGALTIAEGRNIAEGDHNKAVISKWLAENNHLSVGDAIVVELKEGIFQTGSQPMKTWGQPIHLEIAGLFHGSFHQQASEHTPEWGYIDNIIYTDFDTYTKLQKNLDAAGFASEYRDGYTKAEFLVDDPGKLDGIMQQLEDSEEFGLENMKVTVDSAAYQAAAKPYHQVRMFAVILLAAGLFGTGIILCLVMKFWAQGRTHEIGILISIGIKKGEIFGQILTEYLLISAVALTLSFCLSGSLMDRCAAVAEQMMEPKTDEGAFEVTVSDLYEPVIMKTASDEVELEHEVSIGAMGFTAVFLCGILSISTLISLAGMRNIEPKKILQSM